MKLEKFKELLRKVDQGTASDAERFIVDTWYDLFEEKEKQVFSDEAERESTRQRMWHRIGVDREHKPVKWMPRWIRAAAILLAIVAVGGYFWRANDADTTRLVSIATDSSDEQLRLIVTGPGQKKLVTLPDSSLVWLNANSQLEIPEGFGKSARLVALKGEAFFDVKPSDGLVFRIDVGDVSVNVLGTSFNINAYEQLDHTQIWVSTGRVSVGHSTLGEIAQLERGQMLSYKRVGQSSQITQIDASMADGWKDGIITLDKASFKELALHLNNIYGVNLLSEKKSTETYSYNMQIRADRSIEQTMDIICSMHRIKYRRNGNDIILY